MDGQFTAALAHELNNLAGARVERIFFENSTAELVIYTEKQRMSLRISALPAAPFCAVCDETERTSSAPTGFCALLRKHLQPSRITAVEALQNERILRFSFDSRDELGHLRQRYIYAEMMGKFSNIILTDEAKVLGALSVSDLTASKRRLMVGFPYELPPPQNKRSALDISEHEFTDLCQKNSEKTIANFIVSTFFGFSPLVAREIAFRTCQDTAATIGCGQISRLWAAFSEVVALISTKNYTPCAVFVDEKPIDFSFLPIKQYGKTANICQYDSFSELLKAFYSTRATRGMHTQHTNELTKLVGAKISQLQKRLVALANDYAECQKMDKYKKYGDLLTANLYKLKQGKPAVCYDYEEEREVVVPTDERLSPSVNAQRHYKRYQKCKTAAEICQKREAETRQELQYLDSVNDCITRAETLGELAEIKNELVIGGYLSSQKATKTRQKPLPPLVFTTTDGLTVKVGRNNLQNDELTKNAGKNDLWFHVKNAPGSHTVLYVKQGEPSDLDYTQAAEIAARHSSQKQNSVVEVDYTRVKNVKKPPNAKPGLVTYSGYFTAVVRLD